MICKSPPSGAASSAKPKDATRRPKSGTWLTTTCADDVRIWSGNCRYRSRYAKSSGYRQRIGLRGVVSCGHLPAAASHHALSAAGRGALCAQFAAPLCVVAVPPLARGVHPPFPGAARHSLAREDRIARRHVGHDALLRFRTARPVVVGAGASARRRRRSVAAHPVVRHAAPRRRFAGGMNLRVSYSDISYRCAG